MFAASRARPYTLGMVARRLRSLIVLMWGVGLGGAAGARDWHAPEPWPVSSPRLLMIGDSQVYGPVGDAVQSGLVQRGFAVWRRGKPSTGLSRPDRYDWMSEAGAMIAEARPEVVIAQLGGNDVLVLKSRTDRRRVVPFSDESAWRAEYRARVRGFLSLLADDGRRVFMLSPPNRGVGLARVERVRAVQLEAAAGLARVTYIDTFPLTSDEHGRWLRSVVEDGRRVVIRRWDTVHFNDAGGPVIGQRLLAALSAAGLATPAAQ